MTIGDYIWEIFSNIYYFAKDFQTLLAALIVIFGGRAVYRREMKIHREKQKEKSKATALYLQNKIEEILTSLVAFSTLAVEQFNSQKKEIGKGVNPLETLLPMTAGFYDKEDFFTNREILTDIYFLEIEKKSISLFFSSFEELRIILKGPAYPWDLPSGLKKGNLGEAEFKLIKQTNLEIYKMYLAYIESPLKWGIRAVETLSEVTNYKHHNLEKLYEGLENLKKARKNFQEEVKKDTKVTKKSELDKSQKRQTFTKKHQ